jgi:ATP-dependent protease ClpP protease subunit
MIEVKAETNEILLSGIVGDGWDEFPITQKGVVDALRSFGSSPVTIRINSPGGAADEGIGIYNALRSHGGEVTTINDSLAASAASVIFLAGKNRLMADGSRIMIHRAMAFAMGNQDELGKVISALKSYDASLVDIYRQHMVGTDPSEIESMMGNETWFGVDESIDFGLATARYGSSDKKKKKVASQFDQAKANLVRAKMAQFSKHLTSPGQ